MRVTNRLLAGLLALALLVGGLLAAVEIAYGNATGRPLVVPWDAWFEGANGHAWSSRQVRSLLLVLLASGVLLLVLQLVRRGPQSLPVETGAPGGSDGSASRARGVVTVEANTRSLEKGVARAVRALDGVDRASVSFSPSHGQVDVRTPRREIGGLEQAARQAADARLATAAVRRPERLSVRVRRTRRAQRAVERTSVPPAQATR